MNSIFDHYLKKLPPSHMNPQKAITEQVIYNSSENKKSDMKIDDRNFKLPIEKDEDYPSKLMKEKIFDQREISFFKLD